MSELIIKDLCPHCGEKTIVFWEKEVGLEKEDGAVWFPTCQHCDGSLKNLPWENKKWLIARTLKPKKVE